MLIFVHSSVRLSDECLSRALNLHLFLLGQSQVGLRSVSALRSAGFVNHTSTAPIAA